MIARPQPARRMIAAASLALIAALGAPAFGAPPATSPAITPADSAAAEASAAAGALRTATGQLEQALTADDQVIALSEVIRAYEQGQAALRQGLRRASAREDQIRDGFDVRRTELSRILAVMAELGRAPEATLLLHPRGPEATARAGMVMASVAPALRAEADGLRSGLDEIATIRKTQENAAETLALGLGRVQEARRLLASAVSDRSTLPKRFLDDPGELKQLAASAQTLDGFAEGVAALEADVGPPLSDFDGAQGGLPLPAVGQVLRGYDQPDRAGVRRPGLVLATSPRALVTTPWAATIRYRGPLLDYGNVMILEPARGYLLVLAGMAQVFGETGDVLTAGEPVGLMGGDEGTGPEFGINFVVDAAHGTDATTGESLYVELRKGKQTLDPADWFVTDPAVVAQMAAAPGSADDETTEEGSDSGQDAPAAADHMQPDATAASGAEDNGTDE